MQITLTERGQKAASLIERQSALLNEIAEFVNKETGGRCTPTLQACQAILADDVIVSGALKLNQAAS